jgi:hypothetical protein
MSVRPPARSAARLTSRRAAPLLLLPVVLALAGCGGSGTSFAPACPRPLILSDAGDFTRFDQRGTDLTDVVLSGRLEGVQGKCESGGPGVVKATMSVTATISRGPAAGGAREGTFQWFVAVAKGDSILDKKVFNESIAFPANVDSQRVTSQELQLNIPVTRDVSAAAYTVLVGFQLTPEELAYNRAHKRH